MNFVDLERARRFVDHVDHVDHADARARPSYFLERDGLVLTAAAEHDTRTLVYRLSASGLRRYDKAHALWQDAQAEFEKHMKRDRAKALRAELFALTKAAA